MFGKKKKKIHFQAADLLNDATPILNWYANTVLENGCPKDIALEGVMSIVGTCAYYIAGLNHAATARVMVAKYASSIERFDEDLNPKRLTYDQAGQKLNNYYYIARSTADSMMTREKSRACTKKSVK